MLLRVFVVIASLVLLLAGGFFLRWCIAIDKCQDNGGAWNYDNGTCNR